jgi:hypothetical protein
MGFISHRRMHLSLDAAHKNQSEAANGSAHIPIPLHVYKPEVEPPFDNPSLYPCTPIPLPVAAAQSRSVVCSCPAIHTGTGQRQLAPPGTSRCPSHLRSRHRSVCLYPSTCRCAPPIVDLLQPLLHLRATSPAKSTTEPSTSAPLQVSCLLIVLQSVYSCYAACCWLPNLVLQCHLPIYM